MFDPMSFQLKLDEVNLIYSVQSIKNPFMFLSNIPATGLG